MDDKVTEKAAALAASAQPPAPEHVRPSAEDRRRAVLELLGGKATVDQVAMRFGVLQQTVEGWREDALSGIDAALIGKSAREIELEAEVEVLGEAATQWRGCCDTIEDPIAVVFRGCTVVRANQAFARLAGVPVTRLSGLQCAAHLFGKLPCPGPGLRGAERLECDFLAGDRIWLVRSFPIGGETQVVVFKDVTGEREATARSLRAERMIAESRLVGGVAHEINSPLAGILALAQLMKTEERTASDTESLNVIIDAVLRLKRLLDSLLPLAQRLREEDRVPVNLEHVAEDALFSLSHRVPPGVEVLRDLEPAVCLGNARLLSLLVTHLVQNALEAVGTKGRLVVRTGLSSSGAVALSVSDDGPGVPLELAERIFEPFFTTKPRASGLGLSVCGRVVEQHRGAVRLDPVAGAGARFIVELPAA